MRPKRILSIVLILFVFGSVAYMIAKERKTNSVRNGIISSPVSSPNIPEANVPQNTKLVVYYFHGDVRCPTCHKLESYAKEGIETYFAEKLAAGQIVWQAMNVDKPGNSHFVEDYKLVTKSVILSQVTDGRETRWQNLNQIWQKVGNKDDYVQYIKNGINKFLEEKSL